MRSGLAHGVKGTEHNAFPVRSSLCAMGLADQLFRRECNQFWFWRTDTKRRS
jgi:hypothetical protein